jgi:hypothetical protein
MIGEFFKEAPADVSGFFCPFMDSEDSIEEIFFFGSPDSELACPPLTTHERVCSFCGLTLSWVPDISSYFVNDYWIMSLAVALVGSLIGSTIVVVIDAHFTVLHLSPASLFWVLATFALYYGSYFAVILEGPGYLPFYYPAMLGRDATDPYGLSGVVTTIPQLRYAKRNPLPPQTRYFKSARRIVLRPDHFCHWTGCFVGLKNYKLFFLFNFWALFYIAPFCVHMKRMCRVPWGSHMTIHHYILVGMGGTLGVFAAFFFLWQASFIVTIVLDVMNDERHFERLVAPNKEPVQVEWNAERIKRAWTGVFGGADQWYLWFLPIGAFHGVDEYLLVSQLEGEVDG